MNPAGLRVLVASQGHPAISAGATDAGAWRLFQALAGRPDCDAWFLGCNTGGMDLKWRIAQPFSEREFIYTPPATDDFTFANRDALFPPEFESLVRSLRPDVVHLHGLGGLGVEAIDIARHAAPDARIVLTLDDASAICAHFGTMITRPQRQLCRAAKPDACARCFPERDASDFYLRSLYLRRFLDQADLFVATSHSVRQRHIEWGLPAERIAVLDGAGSEAHEAVGPRAADGVLRLGWFGALSPLNGLGVLIEAARLLESRGNIAFEVHGGIETTPPALRGEAEGLMARAGRNVRACGSHDPTQADALMRGIDAVVVPSIGWDGPPGVIEDALRNRRPVICSDAGAMADAVRDGIDGFRFPSGDAGALARLLDRLAALPHKLRDMTSGLRVPPSPADTAERIVALYRNAVSAVR